MNIVILGWGSIIWNPRELPKEGTWQTEGPLLPLEFSRVSKDCRLTAVIDPTDGERCPTRFVMSLRANINDTIRDLRDREGTSSNRIGFVDLKAGKDRAQFSMICRRIKSWCAKEGPDGVVWTDLPPNFKDQTGKEYTVTSAVAYLEGLPKTGREVALRYIRNAPDEVNTPLRRALKASGLLTW
ncbi:MAG: hypothetical protein V3U46_07070 [Acidimicrobiia bacterium]